MCRKMSTHTLRHSYARHLLMNGIPINYLSRWLGHSSIQTLIYLELVPDPTESLVMVPRSPFLGQWSLFRCNCDEATGRQKLFSRISKFPRQLLGPALSDLSSSTLTRTAPDYHHPLTALHTCLSLIREISPVGIAMSHTPAFVPDSTPWLSGALFRLLTRPT